MSAAYVGDGNFASSISDPATLAVGTLGTVSATMEWTFAFSPTYSRALVLTVDAPPAGARILLKCRGRDCPFAARSIATGGTKRCRSKRRRRCRPPGAINLAQLLNHKRLRVGTRLIVQIIKPGWVGKEYVFVIRAGRAPRVQITCPEPGRSSPGAPC